MRAPSSVAGGAVRFLATADWQLGMVRHLLDADAHARFADARVQAIRTIGRLAQERDAAFVVVAGDVFEHHQVDRRTVARACDALREVPVPVLLLPGNHDPLQPGSLWTSEAFRSRCPGQVTVLDSSDPIEVLPGVQVVGAPWRSKRPLEDLAAAALAPLAPTPGTCRVLVAHGATDALHPDATGDPACIRVAALDEALADGRIDVAVLGDRHSCTEVGASGRVWYPGAPEPTDVREVDPGHVLEIALTAAGGCEVTRHLVGTWRFVRHRADLLDEDDVARLAQQLGTLPDRDRTVLTLEVAGALSVRGHARLMEVLEDAAAVFAAVDHGASDGQLVLRPDDDDLTGLHGAVAAAAARLRREAGDGDGSAADALSLLHRLRAGAA